MSDRPFLGICLGFQALFNGSQEWPYHEGLAIFNGTAISIGHPYQATLETRSIAPCPRRAVWFRIPIP